MQDDESMLQEFHRRKKQKKNLTIPSELILDQQSESTEFTEFVYIYSPYAAKICSTLPMNIDRVR